MGTAITSWCPKTDQDIEVAPADRRSSHAMAVLVRSGPFGGNVSNSRSCHVPGRIRAAASGPRRVPLNYPLSLLDSDVFESLVLELDAADFLESDFFDVDFFDSLTFASASLEDALEVSLELSAVESFVLLVDCEAFESLM